MTESELQVFCPNCGEENSYGEGSILGFSASEDVEEKCFIRLHIVCKSCQVAFYIDAEYLPHQRMPFLLPSGCHRCARCRKMGITEEMVEVACPMVEDGKIGLGWRWIHKSCSEDEK